jgi:hypothetical protein
MEKYHHYKQTVFTMGKKNRTKSKKLTKEQNRKLNLRKNQIEKNVAKAIAERDKVEDEKTKAFNHVSKSVGVYGYKHFVIERDNILIPKSIMGNKKQQKKMKKQQLVTFPESVGGINKVICNREILGHAAQNWQKNTMVGFDFDPSECEDLSYDIRFQFYLQMIINPPTKQGGYGNWNIGKDKMSCWMDISLDLTNAGCGIRRLLVAYFAYDACYEEERDKKLVEKEHSLLFMNYYGDFVDMPGKNTLREDVNIHKYTTIKNHLEKECGEMSNSDVDELIDEEQNKRIIDICIAGLIVNINEVVNEDDHLKFMNEEKKKKMNQDEVDVNDDSDEDYDTCDEYE